ncbi:hypothetical protein FHW83_001185 [Duganella sp. SG902]|uniref:hypothetical protein n=1 Tax=Duganella sp. SG902 TaxID=2587016 RepID=UPI001809F64F|nr:hypothetical protein [Duganella sp. SG902]NVM75405.1 hypothetical protein [Duganella sp. SG902]
MPHIANPVAQAQAANLRTDLLLERCSHGHAPLDHAATAWRAARQAGFLAWLDAGGFTKENSGMAPLFSAPQRDLHEESKFTLLRINDAVE